MQSVLPGMKERKFGRIINILSAMVKNPHVIMGLSTSARSGLLGLSKGLSREMAQFNITINNLLPERIDTDRQTRVTRQSDRQTRQCDRQVRQSDRQ